MWKIIWGFIVKLLAMQNKQPVNPVEPPIIEPPVVEPPVEPPVVEPPVEPPVVEPPAPIVTDHDRLKRICWWECRGEPRVGIRAVMEVIRNRKNNKHWPNTYEEVIMQSAQFTPTTNSAYLTKDVSSGWSIQDIDALVDEVLNGEGTDVLTTDYFYFSVGKPTAYGKHFIHIGNHWFARDQRFAVDYHVRLSEWGFAEMIANKGIIYAVKQFQAAFGLTVDGIVGPITNGALDKEVIVPRIPESEMACQCNKYCDGWPVGHGITIGVRILAERIFREVEKKYPNTQFYITNRAHPRASGIAGGIRCAKWNMDRGGAAGSRHLRGDAMDLWGTGPSGTDAQIRAEIERVALVMNTKGGVGSEGGHIVHIDTRGNKARWKY